VSEFGLCECGLCECGLCECESDWEYACMFEFIAITIPNKAGAAEREQGFPNTSTGCPPPPFPAYSITLQ